MKKVVTITEERNVCDYCEDENKETYGECPICGAHACYECKKDHFTERTAELHISSSGNQFCNKCIANPPKEFKKLMSLYDEMDALKNRETNFYESERKIQKILEDKIREEKKCLT
ncbi:MAG: hypothetical protein M0R80_03885 [Proteobacteria bacterium]|jgi:hypothetical protein|nr:hypothetical protein [Pseudomonadota bacterium]